MPISIDWGTRVVNVPKDYLALIQSVPTEIRQLDLDQFRLDLRDLEDSDYGMAYPRTHIHNSTVTVGGVVLARVIIMVNGYTVTFEDGQYAVNLVGANSNVGDVVNVNQVSVRSANSAGLQDLSTLLASAYQGVVVLDAIKGQAGTSIPIGTLKTPSNNLQDAVAIAKDNGIGSLRIVGDYTFTTGDVLPGFNVIGHNMTLTQLTVETGADVLQCEFSECHLLGVLDGGSTVERALITDLNYVDGFIHRSVLSSGTITLGAGSAAYFLDCYSGVPGVSTPTIDMNGPGQSLVIRGYNGGVKITNKSGPEPVSIDLNSGQVILTSSVTNGLIVVRGTGKLVDEANNDIPSGNFNGATIINETVPYKTALAVWNHTQ